MLASARALLEVAGVEPASSGMLVGLLRAHPGEDLGSPPLTGGGRRPQPQWSVPPGPEAIPGGEPLKMASRFRPSGWARRDALLVGTRQRGWARAHWCSHLCLVPAFSRRSG